MTSVTFHGGWFQETLLPWTEQDNEMIGHVGTYRLLLQNGRDIPSLFWGGCRVEGKELSMPQEIPEGSNMFFWPKSQKFVKNEQKRNIYLYPFLFVPRYIYAYKPLQALRFAVVYVFQRIFGDVEYDSLEYFLKMSKIYYTPGFQTILSIAEQIWCTGTLFRVPKLVDEDFMKDTVLSAFVEERVQDELPEAARDLPSLKFLNLDARANIKKAASNRKLILDGATLHTGMICVKCLCQEGNGEQYFMHMRHCLQDQFPIEGNLYKCTQCLKSAMNIKTLLWHLHTGCPKTFDSKCIYCEQVPTSHNCGGIFKLRQKIVSLIDSTNTVCNADIINRHNFGLLALFLEIRRLNVFMSTFEKDCRHEDIMRLHVLQNPLKIDNLDTEVLLRQVQSNLYYVTRTGSLELSNGFGLLSKAYGKSEEDIINLVVMDGIRARCAINEEGRIEFEDLDLTRFCVYCLSFDTSQEHKLERHPKCFCGIGPFRDVDRLIKHFENHDIDRACAYENCDVSFDNLAQYAEHYRKPHKNETTTIKLKCMEQVAKSCGVANIRIGYQVLHNLVYHVHRVEDLETFFTRSEILLSRLKEKDCEEIVDRIAVAGEGIPSQEEELVDGAESSDEDDKDEGKHGDLGDFNSKEGDKESSKEEQKPNLDGRKKGEGRLDIGKSEDGEGRFPCRADKCQKINLVFETQEQLDEHVETTHACLYEDCDFKSLEDDVLREHMREHNKLEEGIRCNLCEVVCEDRLQLAQHRQSRHNYGCYICKKENFLSKKALEEHIQECTEAPFEDRVSYGPNETEESSPLELLIDLIEHSGLKVDSKGLKSIKSASIKQNRLMKNPELNISQRTEIIFDLPIFENGDRSVSVPSSRLKTIPRFTPKDDDAMGNYISFAAVLDELSSISTEFKLSEASYCSLLLQQISPAAKLRMKALLTGSQSLNSVRLETLISIARQLFFLLNLQSIFCQASNLDHPASESLLDFFARLSMVSKLGSFYLEQEKRAAWIDSNVKLQFLRQAPAHFRKTIQERENTLGVRYTPSELLKMYLTFQKEFKAEEKVNTLYRIQESSGNYNKPEIGQKERTQGRRPESFDRRRPRAMNTNPRERLRQPYTRNYQESRNSPGRERRPQNCQAWSQENRENRVQISAKAFELYRRLGRKPDPDRIICLACGRIGHLAKTCRKFPGPLSRNICRKCNLYHETCSD